MSGLIVIGLQIGVVLTGFVATGKVLDWYHSESAPSKGLGARSKRKSRRTEDDDFFSTL